MGSGIGIKYSHHNDLGYLSAMYLHLAPVYPRESAFNSQVNRQLTTSAN